MGFWSVMSILHYFATRHFSTEEFSFSPVLAAIFLFIPEEFELCASVGKVLLLALAQRVFFFIGHQNMSNFEDFFFFEIAPRIKIGALTGNHGSASAFPNENPNRE